MNKKNDVNRYALLDYDFVNFAPGMRVVDIGCGKGRQLQKLAARGCVATGVEPNQERLGMCAEQGLEAVAGNAERLPFADASFDGAICKGVIPFTAEPVAFHEVARVLKPGAIAQFCYLGAGFYLRLLLLGSGGWLKQRVYGFRVFINTWLFALTGRVLPGYWGDTIYQSRRRLRKYYLENRFTLLRETPSKKFLGLPVFIYHAFQAAGKVRPANLTEPATEEAAALTGVAA